MSENIRNAERDLLQTNDGVIDYWLLNRGTFPHLSRVALRLLATPASSASSERDFSLLKLSLSKHKCSMKDDIIDSKAVLHSFLDDSA